MVEMGRVVPKRDSGGCGFECLAVDLNEREAGIAQTEVTPRVDAEARNDANELAQRTAVADEYRRRPGVYGGLSVPNFR